ncbi:MAG: DUF4873 domain-containing protein [Micromonosporaceae bacterium]|nr:DUF4873 domain-containing protein [Micromonosporaceae bacterium]
MRVSEHDQEGYQGAATLRVGEAELDVEVTLRGQFQPIDGLYHWYGRVRAVDRLDAIAGGRKTAVRLRTREGEATGELSDPDPWGRYRIMGTSRPPFRAG